MSSKPKKSPPPPAVPVKPPEPASGAVADSPPDCAGCRHFFVPAPGVPVGDCREGPPTVPLGLPGPTAPVHAYRVVPAALPACGRFTAR